MPEISVLIITFIISLVASIVASFIMNRLKNLGFWLQTLVLFILLFVSVTGAVWYYGKPSNLDHQLENYRADFMALRTDFEQLKCYDCPAESLSETDRLIKQELLKETPDLLDKMNNIPDFRMDEGYVVLKYDLIGFLTAMYCELLDDSLSKYREAEKGLKYVDLAFSNIDVINKKKEFDDYLRHVSEWLSSDDVPQRLQVEKAWLKAVQFRLDGEIRSYECREVRDILDGLKPAYRLRNPLTKNPSLKYFLNCN